ncbi:MAG: methionyl-tRNA formyltransferase [Ruminococcaceae bacterium]|nr:methionyl-tRNA formyltransferase [Oscillospiraceae bacterium]
MKVIFMGTPDFAVPCLEKLIEDGHQVEAVFTREDKPVGRKKVLTAPPVKEIALKYGIEVYQPKKLRDNPEVFEVIKNINPDLIVVVAYGRILPKEILDFPKYGCVNVHGSLLPRHRGSSPIQWSIVCGDKVTGVTTMLMDEGIDTGDILEVSQVPIEDTDTGGSLFDKLCIEGAKLLSTTIKGLQSGSITPIKQKEEGANYAPMLTKEMGLLDFNKNANELWCLIRGFNPWPLTYFYYNDRRFKVFDAKPIIAKGHLSGEFFIKENKAYIACADDTALEINEICPDGSKKMDSSAFVNGRFIPIGEILNK